jgi:hypothetical protein
MKSARMYDFTIPANGSFQLNVEGEYVRIMSSTGNVELVTETYRIGPIAAGQGQANTPFKRLTINDKSGVANKGVILVAASDFVDQRIAGEVSIIDGSKYRALAGGAFTAHLFAPASAGNFSGVQLWNPVASGKNIIIEQIIPYITGGLYLQVVMSAVQLPAGIAANIGNKKSGGPLPGGLALITSASLTAVAPLATFGIGNTTQYKPVNPYVLTPGYGLNLASPTLNIDCGAEIEFFEESI